MLQLARKNLQGRKAYSAIIAVAVAAAVGMAIFTTAMTGSVRQGLESKRRMLGADLAVVPAGSKERGHIYLSKGPPDHAALPQRTLARLADFPEIELAVPQKLLNVVTVDNVKLPLIAFDPEADFTVLPWLDRQNAEDFPGRNSGLVLGALAPADVFASAVSGRTELAGGRLLTTGSFMDTAVFVPRPGAEITPDPTWILLRLRPDAQFDVTSNRLQVNIPGVEVIPRLGMFKTLDDQLYGLIEGGAFGLAALLAILGALMVTGAMFALMAHERKREFGLFKAIGAKNSFVFKLVMAEAALLGLAGTALGTGAAAAGLFAINLVSGDFTFSPLADAPRLLAAAALIMAVAVFTALWPALGATRLEPYAAIRSGE